MICETDNIDYKNAILLMYNRTVFSLNCKLLSDSSLSAYRDDYEQYRLKLVKLRYDEISGGNGSIKDFLLFYLVKYLPGAYTVLSKIRASVMN